MHRGNGNRELLEQHLSVISYTKRCEAIAVFKVKCKGLSHVSGCSHGQSNVWLSCPRNGDVARRVNRDSLCPRSEETELSTEVIYFPLRGGTGVLKYCSRRSHAYPEPYVVHAAGRFGNCRADLQTIGVAGADTGIPGRDQSATNRRVATDSEVPSRIDIAIRGHGKPAGP